MSNQQEILNLNSLFQQQFLEPKNFFMYCYQQPPCITWVDMLNTERALQYLQDEYGDVITGIYQYSKYERKKRGTEVTRTIITFRDNCIVELCSDWADVLHTRQDYEMAHILIKELSRFKRREKKKDFEINLILRENDGLDLKSMEIKKTNLDLKLFYEDDFLPVHKTILDRLNKKEDKGIVLLHGLPGTGKTTYIRYLVGKLKKKVLLVPPAMAHIIMGSDFMNMLIDNPDSILVIEDAENVIPIAELVVTRLSVTY